MENKPPYLQIKDGLFKPNELWVKTFAAAHGTSEHAAVETLQAMLKEEATLVANKEGYVLREVYEEFGIPLYYCQSVVAQIMSEVSTRLYSPVPNLFDPNKPERLFASKEEAWDVIKKSEVCFPGNMSKKESKYIFCLNGYFSTEDLEAILYLRRLAATGKPDDDRLPWSEHALYGAIDYNLRQAQKR